MQFVHKEGKVLNCVILILVAYVLEQEEMPYFVVMNTLQNIQKLRHVTSCRIYTDQEDMPY